MNWLKLDNGRLINLSNITEVPSRTDIEYSQDRGEKIEMHTSDGRIIYVEASDAYRIRTELLSMTKQNRNT